MDYSIDIIQHKSSGERFVVRVERVYNVLGMAGPLNNSDMRDLEADPQNWDADPDFDLDAVNREFHAGHTWQHVKELYSNY